MFSRLARVKASSSSTGVLTIIKSDYAVNSTTDNDLFPDSLYFWKFAWPEQPYLTPCLVTLHWTDVRWGPSASTLLNSLGYDKKSMKYNGTSNVVIQFIVYNENWRDNYYSNSRFHQIGKILQSHCVTWMNASIEDRMVSVVWHEQTVKWYHYSLISQPCFCHLTNFESSWRNMPFA